MGAEENATSTGGNPSSNNTTRRFSWLGWPLGGAVSGDGQQSDSADQQLYGPDVSATGEDGGRINLSRRGSRGNRLEEISRQGSVIFGFGDSDGSTDLSDFEEGVGARLEEYQGIGSTASEASDEGDVNGEAEHAGLDAEVEEREGEEEYEEEQSDEEESGDEESGDEDDEDERSHEEDLGHEQELEFVEASGRAIL